MKDLKVLKGNDCFKILCLTGGRSDIHPERFLYLFNQVHRLLPLENCFVVPVANGSILSNLQNKKGQNENSWPSQVHGAPLIWKPCIGGGQPPGSSTPIRYRTRRRP